MALTKINNNTLSAVTALPAAIATGKVLQVVNATSTTEVVESGSSFTDTGLSAAITPSSSSSKILISAHIQGVGKNGDAYVTLKLLRGSTDIVANFEQRGGDTNTSNTNKVGGCSVTYLDSPNTTSATTYKVQMKGNGNSYAQTGDSNPKHSITLIEVAG
tara:strand:+ start:235 stop:714 length:480 start_codon:yes stop_codon:yes gene_type:complete